MIYKIKKTTSDLIIEINDIIIIVKNILFISVVK